MKPYRDRTGKSRIKAYRVGEDFIEIQYFDHSTYLYKDCMFGEYSIQTVRAMAESGRGLDAFIKKIDRITAVA